MVESTPAAKTRVEVWTHGKIVIRSKEILGSSSKRCKENEF